MDLERLGKVIKRRREDLMLRQEDLAERSGVKKQAIYRIEKGLVPNLGQKRLGQIAAALETTIHDLLVAAEDTGKTTMTVHERAPVYAPVAGGRVRLPPRAYQRVFEYLELLRSQGFADAEIDIADEFMTNNAYNKLNARDPETKTEEQLIESIDALWQFVREQLESDK